MVGPEKVIEMSTISLCSKGSAQTHLSRKWLVYQCPCSVISCPVPLACAHIPLGTKGREGGVKTGIPAPMCLSSAALMWSRPGVSPLSLSLSLFAPSGERLLELLDGNLVCSMLLELQGNWWSWAHVMLKEIQIQIVAICTMACVW